jgi:hypothetical protein
MSMVFEFTDVEQAKAFVAEVKRRFDLAVYVSPVTVRIEPEWERTIEHLATEVFGGERGRAKELVEGAA